MLLRLYQFVTQFFSPFIDLYLYKRKRDGKEDPKRFRERLGYPSIPRPQGKILWIHAASVGESLSVLPLIKAISEHYSDMNILVTTGTVTSASMLESRLPDKAFHQYVPIDRPFCVRRFLKYWRPAIALWVESELWPNLVVESSKYCQVILINGRLSQDSFNHWKKYRTLGEQIVSKFSLILAQTKEYAKRYETIGGKRVKYVGNLKYDSPALPSDSKKMGDIVSLIGERHVWVAASTHDGEEDILADTHLVLKETYPDILTIIVPRHPKRAESIKKAMATKDLSVALRSAGEELSSDIDIYLADTMGELGLFYRLTSIVFIGGSLVPHGGQNPLEAARLDCAIVFGPHMDNFDELRKEMLASGAAIEVPSAEGLAETIGSLFSDNEKTNNLANAAQSFVSEKAGVLDKTIEELAPFIEKVRS